MTFEALAADVGPRLEAALDAILSPDPAPGEIARPARLLAAMRHAMLGGGKVRSVRKGAREARAAPELRRPPRGAARSTTGCGAVT